MSEEVEFSARLADIARRVEARLEAALHDEPAKHERVRPPRLLAAMRHGALGGGKRLRAFLTIATAKALGGDGDEALTAGAAIECLHAYSLVHDDLPAMDDDDLRRGRPTVHRAFDEATAILAGDALLTLAFELFADPAHFADPSLRADLCLGLARAGGLAGMVGGQVLDMAAESAPQQANAAEVQTIQALKTGALLRFSVEAGARIANASGSSLRALRAFGEALGEAFQIADDVLDVESDATTLGKAVGKDASRNKPTSVAALGLAGAKARRDALAAAAETALIAAGLGEGAADLRAAARFAARRAT